MGFLDFFRSPPLLPQETVEWVEAAMTWAFTQFGGRKTGAVEELILPTPDYFGHCLRKGKLDVASLFETVRELSGMSDWR